MDTISPRKPKQKRAIAKKEKIITVGYAVFCETGYYHTTTAEIARAAGVSTGIVYNYFQDKMDILREVVKRYLAMLAEQTEPVLAGSLRAEMLPEIIARLLDAAIASHTMNRKAHDEFIALALLHEDIHAMFDTFEDTVVKTLCARLTEAGIGGAYVPVRVRLGYGLIEQTCHLVMQRELRSGELQAMKAATIRSVTSLLLEPEA